MRCPVNRRERKSFTMTGYPTHSFYIGASCGGVAQSKTVPTNTAEIRITRSCHGGVARVFFVPEPMFGLNPEMRTPGLEIPVTMKSFAFRAQFPPYLPELHSAWLH
jgi:hypothetical protein